MEVLYKISARSEGGREGKVKTSDGMLDVKMTMPKEMGGSGEHLNPEQLFASGYAACFNGALQLVARTDRVAIKDPIIEIEVAIGKDPAGGLKLAAKVKAILGGLTQEEADKLVAKAHTVCPYSKAIKGNVDVTVVAEIK